MNRYKPSHPRFAFGLGAVAAAALTLGSLVVLPAEVEATDFPAAAVVATAEPHVDAGHPAAVVARERRHELVARAIGAVESAGKLRFAKLHDEESNP